jgi:hypothetical protein
MDDNFRNKIIKTAIMKKTFILAALTIITTAFTFRAGDKIVTVSEFGMIADSAGLLFEMPAGYKECIIKSNFDLPYQFAIKNKEEDFEVRYSVWPMKSLLENANTNQDPNSMHKILFVTTVMNMTGGVGAKINPFPPNALKETFNADDGSVSFFEFNSEFGKGYKYGQMVCLHKNNTTNVIITFLSNDKKKHSELVLKAFHSLKFK